MNLRLSKKKLYKAGRIIFWIYIIFLTISSLAINILTYKKVETFTAQRIFESPPSPERLSQQAANNDKAALNTDEEKIFDFEREFVSAGVMNFPQGESAHDNMSIEWWYTAANLNDIKSDKKFNLALSIFKNSSSFIKISDLEKGKTYVKKLPFLAENLFSKKELDINFGQGRFLKEGLSKYKISFKQDEIEFNLTFESLKNPLVIFNNDNFFNYQQTKVKTSGEIVINNIKYQVEGYSWFEHQGFSVQSVGLYYGWRWVAMQLDNNIELLWIDAFPRKGKMVEAFNGIIVYDNGNKRLLTSQNFSSNNISSWQNEKYGELYPLMTELKIPALSADLKIEITPVDYGIEQLGGIFEGGGVISGYYNGEKVSGLVQQEINPPN